MNIERLIELDELREEAAKRENEENQKKIGDLRTWELKKLIRETIYMEAHTGKLPFLNRDRRKVVNAWLVVLIIVAIIGFFGFRSYRLSNTNSDYYVTIGNRIRIQKIMSGKLEVYEMKLFNGRWSLCSEDGVDCKILFEPLNVRFGASDRFIFKTQGTLLWVKDNMTDATPVKQMDGEWAFRNEKLGEEAEDGGDFGWTTFNEMWDRQNRALVDP